MPPSVARLESGSDHAHFDLPPDSEKTRRTPHPCWRAKPFLKRLTTGKYVSWILAHMKWEDWKPVVRSAVAAWAGLVLVLVPRTLKVLGQASFFTLVAALLAHPGNAAIIDIERQINNLFLVCVAWGWACLAILIANAARDGPLDQQELQRVQDQYGGLGATNYETQLQRSIFDGRFIQAAPSIVCAVFLGTGCAFYLYLKTRLSPGPWAMGCVFSCICLTVTLTYAPLFPYPNYTLGAVFALPLAVQSAINIVCAIFVFPTSVNSQFLSSMIEALSPLEDLSREEAALLDIPVTSHDWLTRVQTLRALNVKSAGAIIGLRVKEPYLEREFCVGRLKGKDLKALFDLMRIVHLRSGGIITFSEALLVAFHNEHLLSESVSIAEPSSRPASLAPSRTSSHHGTPTSMPGTPTGSHAELPHASSLHGLSKHSWANFLARARYSAPIGVFESQRYMFLERQLKFKDQGFVRAQFEIVSASSADLNLACQEAIKHASDFFRRVNKDRFIWRSFFRRRAAKDVEAHIVSNHRIAREFREILERYREVDRLAVLQPYERLFTSERVESVPYRALFWSFSYQYALDTFASALLELLDRIAELEETRLRPQLWVPMLGIRRFLREKEEESRDDDEDPEQIPGLDDGEQYEAKPRDPDTLPPANIFEHFGYYLWRCGEILTSPSALFAAKVGTLTVLVTLPAFLRASAGWYYYRRGLWVAIMAQLTSAMYTGDTVLNWVTRIISSTAGVIIGLLIWSVGAQTGRGTPYGIAAICFVAFPLIFYVKMYFPSTPVAMLVWTVSIALVIGYSWQDAHQPTLANVGWGWELAWRRLLLVLIGVTAAFVFAYVPPQSSGKRNMRILYSNTIARLGDIYCALISYAAHSPHKHAEEEKMTKNLLAVKAKLRKSALRHDFVAFELSLRGRWPRARYQALLNVQLDLVELLSQLLSIIKQLDPAWTHGVLRRSKFLDPRFIGDVLACIDLCSVSIRNGSPLPQVTPSPLVDRSYSASLGLNVAAGEDDVAHGLPKHVSLETLKSKDYWLYCVAYSTSQSILVRIDRMVLVTKTIVGERFQIDLGGWNT